MEDVFSEPPLSAVENENIKNGIAHEIMANFPEGTSSVNDEDKSIIPFDNSALKLNGSAHSSDDADEDSETDALVIDESVPKKRVKKRKANKLLENNNSAEENQSDVVLHSNPYFHESLFELSQQHHNTQFDVTATAPTNQVKTGLRPNKLKRAKPKLREYAQYLGLQPAVQFKCSKCRQAGFDTLQNLNNHIVNCTSDPNSLVEVEDNSVSSFKLTRKVFLCSACGTYYENWNLYMHMLEIHRRYICLYCLGMFSALDDLCQHIQNKHNWIPQQRDTLEDFFKEYKEPCFIVCCECKKLFNEQDNFFYHNCSKTIESSDSKNKNKTKLPVRPENHVTGDSFAESPTTIVVESENPVSPPMVRSEVNSKETSEVLPEVPNFVEKNSEEIEATTTTQLPEKMNDDENKNDSDVDSISKEITEERPSIPTMPELNEEKMDTNDSSQEQEGQEETPNPNNDDTSTSHNENNLEIFQETRKVPKLSLKLPKLDEIFAQEDSDDSDKLEMDQIESENDHDHVDGEEKKVEEIIEIPQIPVAGPDVNIVELELEQPLDKFDIKILLQKCLLATVPICVYCNHARKISVNGKQLGLHAIAEHRYSAVVKSITAEELIPESFVDRIKESLDELDKIWFNLESNISEEAVTFSHVFECFQCRYSTNIHKELYLHNRKMHTKNLLLCIMCKSNFYSYSELVCHLCPGDYILDYDVQYRCCMCVGDDLPSAFRLMVHLRKRHHVCDVCLEMCHNQYKLSNHVWKHKLHHFCYRCGIAYRNKQDITRHLFWKHGTESVLCKKCLQKKWPHVFHFCIPPSVFTCEECSLNFTKAVYLKVHKRIHSNDKPHACTFEGCEETFVSKKLQQKHERHHYELPEEEKPKEETIEEVPENNNEASVEIAEEKEDADKPKPKVDVYDLPELNLSESSDSESDEEKVPKQQADTKKTEEEEIIETLDERTLEVEQELANNITIQEENKQPEVKLNEPVLESIWDDFKIYQAKKEQIDHMFIEPEKNTEEVQVEPEPEPETLTLHNALRDHDYFYNNETSKDTNVITEVEPDLSNRVDHDYCTPAEIPEKPVEDEVQQPPTIENKKNSSSSSSDSDGSSCSCGSNCSCSSSSSSSSSSDSSDSDSSTEEGRRRQQAKRDKKKSKSKEEKKQNEEMTENPTLETPILETDLDTTESETDEEFYDKQPQKIARKLLEEKRNQILAEAGSLPFGSFFEASRNSTPSLPEEVKPKKKSKSKKRKKKKSERRELENQFKALENLPTVAPLTITLTKVTPSVTPNVNSAMKNVSEDTPKQDSESNVRSSKRRRVPNKFYGYSSDEEAEKSQSTPVKWRKVESPQVPLQPQQQLVPPLTIKTASITPTVEPITIRTKPGELKVQPRHSLPPRVPPLQINAASLSRTISEDHDSDSNESTTEEQPQVEPPNRPEPTKNVQLYCYCRCPYDEVSEMIGCDSHDCTIEWFHFECVGIMVPPKGQWFCPDCRKRKQQRRELLPV